MDKKALRLEIKEKIKKELEYQIDEVWDLTLKSIEIAKKNKLI